jgi:hypothetical protein
MNADFQTGKQKRQTKYDPQIELKKKKKKRKTHTRTHSNENHVIPQWQPGREKKKTHSHG